MIEEFCNCNWAPRDIGPDSRSDALRASIVGNREGSSGKCRLKSPPPMRTQEGNQIMEITDLNGFYEIIYLYEPPPPSEGGQRVSLIRAYGAVVNGRFVAVDIGGGTSAGSITPIKDDKVSYKIDWDLSQADPDVFLLDDNGQPTRDSVSYAGELQVIELGDKLVASGQLTLGTVSIEINVKRLWSIE